LPTMPDLLDTHAPCRVNGGGMTNTHDQSPWRRLEISVLVVGLVLMAAVAAFIAVRAWAWTDKPLLWSVFLIALSGTMLLGAELFRRTSIWSEAVAEPVRDLGWALTAVSILSPLAITYPDQCPGDWAVLALQFLAL
jgi:hypothetical protein